MPSSAVQNPPAAADSKSAKKKKAKAERTDSPAPSASPAADKAVSVSGADASEDGLESPYIRELQKYVAPPLLSTTHSLVACLSNPRARNIRNVNKKIVRRPPPFNYEHCASCDSFVASLELMKCADENRTGQCLQNRPDHRPA